MRQIINLLIYSSLILLFVNTASAAVGEVQNLRPTSAHDLNTPSQVPLVEMGWDLPEGYTKVTGYYHVFTTESNYTLDDTTTTGLQIIETAYASQDYTGSNDISIYVYVAAVVFDEENFVGETGETTKFGPIRVDTVAPDNAAVSVDQYINSATASLSIGGFGSVGDATEIYISNSGYETSGSWETIASTKPWPIDSEGRKTIYVTFRDDAGNTSEKTIITVYDATAPTASISTTSPMVTNSNAIPVTITFNDPTQIGVSEISGFGRLSLETSSISITNATVTDLSEISSNGFTATCQMTVIPQSQGNVSLEVLASAIEDQAGNENTASSIFELTYDTVNPQVTITSSTTARTNQTPMPVLITFSEPVSDFAENDIAITGASNYTLTASGDNIHYSLDVLPSADGTITIDIPESGASDTAGNTNTAAQTFTRVFDSQAPTVNISGEILENTTTETSPIALTFTFSETVTGFTVNDITTQNASLDNFSGSSDSDTYTVDVFPVMPSGLTETTISVQVNANMATDLAGNDNSASDAFQFTYTADRPTVSLALEPSKNITPQPAILTITFSRPVEGFLSADIVITNGSISNFTGLNGDNSYTDTYRCTLTPDGQTDVSVKVNEDAAQTSTGYTNTASATLIYDINNAPEITIAQTTIQTFEDTSSPSLAITTTDADNDPLTVSVLANHLNQYTLTTDNANRYTLIVLPESNHNASIAITLITTDPYNLTHAVSFMLEITPVNDVPIISFQTVPLQYTENTLKQPIDPQSEITDIDSTTFSNGFMNLVLTQNATLNDHLSLVSTDSIAITKLTILFNDEIVASYTLSNNHHEITITFANHCRPLTATAILQSIVYENTSENPSTLERQIQVSLSDGMDLASQTQQIKIIAINDLPYSLSLDGSDTIKIPNGLTPGEAIATLMASDAETISSALQYTFVSGDGDDHNKLFTIDNAKLWAVNRVSYNEHEYYNIRLQVTDSDGGSIEKSFFISVVPPPYDHISVPTLNEWGSIILVTIMMLGGFYGIRKKYAKKSIRTKYPNPQF